MTRGLVKRAKAAGHEVLVLCCHESPDPDPANFHLERTRFDDVPVFELHFNLSVCPDPARYEYDNPFVGKQVLSILEEFKPDIAHCLHPMKLSKSALDACFKKKVPVVTTLSDFWLICPRHSLLTWENKLCDGPNRFLKCSACLRHLHGYPHQPEAWRDLGLFVKDVQAISARPESLKQSVLKSKRILALSSFQKSKFVENGYPIDRIELLRHGVESSDLIPDEAKLKQLNVDRSDGVLRMGFIGSVVPIKGLHILLEAFKLCSKQTAELFVYGELRDDPYSISIRRQAEKNPRVRLMGRFPQEDFGTVLKSLDVLLVPALWYENDPLVVKAAQFLGVPLILSKIGSLAEMVEHPNTGWLVDADDIAAWAKAIEKAQIDSLPSPDPKSVRKADDHAADLFEIYAREARRYS